MDAPIELALHERQRRPDGAKHACDTEAYEVGSARRKALPINATWLEQDEPVYLGKLCRLRVDGVRGARACATVWADALIEAVLSPRCRRLAESSVGCFTAGLAIRRALLSRHRPYTGARRPRRLPTGEGVACRVASASATRRGNWCRGWGIIRIDSAASPTIATRAIMRQVTKRASGRRR